MKLSLVFLCLTKIVTITQAYDQSLHDCKAVAAQFKNTCAHGNYDTPAASVDDMDHEIFECPNKPKCIPGGVKTGTTCAWDRKLCVTCRSDHQGVTRIRVQTNNLPDHCVSSNSIKANNFDYEVIFNSKEVHGDWLNVFTTQHQLDNAVCPIAKDFDVSGALQLTEYGDLESENAMGFATNGVAFQFANQIQEDPVYPITVLNEQPLDICLGHNQQNSDSGMYHYHEISPCLNPHFLNGKTMSACKDNTECDQDITSWALSGYAGTYKQVIGIAKDGHVLYGPYDEAGNMWESEDVDACNGAWSGDLGDYFYVGTQWHPYVIGCQGPSNFPQKSGMYAQCSLNGMDQYVEPCEDDDTWRYVTHMGNPKTCNWVALSPGERCGAVNADGIAAVDACPQACNSCSSR